MKTHNIIRRVTQPPPFPSLASAQFVVICCREDRMQGIMLWKFPALMEKITWQTEQVSERTSKSSRARADGGIPHVSASGPDSSGLNSADFQVPWSHGGGSPVQALPRCTSCGQLFQTVQQLFSNSTGPAHKHACWQALFLSSCGPVTRE
jgi:hypothetical protein